MYVVYGKQMDVEFKSYNPRGRPSARGGRGGRGGGAPSQPREEIYRRWGYKITVKPIFGMPKFLEGNQVNASILNNLVQTTVRLARELTDAKFIKDEHEKVMIPETQQAIEKTLQWHLFKGGLKIPELESQGDIEAIISQGF